MKASEFHNRLQRRGLNLGMGELFAFISASSYGTGNVFIRAVSQQIFPLLSVSLMLVPSLVFSVLNVVRQPSKLSQLWPKSNKFIGWIGVVALMGHGIASGVLANFLNFEALKLGGVLVAIPIASTNALWAALVASVILKESLTKRIVFGMLIALAGVSILSYGQKIGTPVSPEWFLAVPYGFGAAIAWGIGPSFLRFALKKGVSSFIAFGFSNCWAIITILLYMLLTGHIEVIFNTPMPIIGGALFAGIFNSGGLIFWTFALMRTTVAKGGAIKSLSVAISPIIAVIFLAESVNVFVALGIMLVLAGVLSVQYTGKRVEEVAEEVVELEPVPLNRPPVS